MSPTKAHILIRLSSSDKTSFGKERFAIQSRPQKVFSAIWEVESEVNNGGFAQYFLNSSAESASFVVEALETVGAPKTANICKNAIEAAFPSGLPHSVEAIRAAAASFSDEVLAALESLNEDFFHILTISTICCLPTSPATQRILAHCRKPMMRDWRYILITLIDPGQRSMSDNAWFRKLTIAASRTRPWLASGWGCRGRRLSR